MKEAIRQLFDRNIELLDMTDKAVLYFREQKYDKALEFMPSISDKMRGVIDTLIEDKDYFELVSVESLMEMLEGILDAGRSMDYVLLADLLELQLATLLCNVQALIMEKEEDAVYSEELYRRQCAKMAEVAKQDTPVAAGVESLLLEPICPQKLLEDGYRIEYTSCGLMTVAVGVGNKTAVYLHSNHKISLESFLLARAWAEPDRVDTYLIYGFDLGYHVAELRKLVPEARIEVYEPNGEILKLACAFAPLEKLLSAEGLHLIYDPDGTAWTKRVQRATEREKICIHVPAIRKTKKGMGDEA